MKKLMLSLVCVSGMYATENTQEVVAQEVTNAPEAASIYAGLSDARRSHCERLREASSTCVKYAQFMSSKAPVLPVEGKKDKRADKLVKILNAIDAEIASENNTEAVKALLANSK